MNTEVPPKTEFL